MATVNWVSSHINRGQDNSIRVRFESDVSGLTPSDFIVTGEATGISAGPETYVLDNYYFELAITSGINTAGEVRLRLPQNAVSPPLDTSFDWILRWNAAGQTSATRRINVYPPTLTITLSSTEVLAINDTITATFTFMYDGAVYDVSNFTADDVSVTDGATKGDLTRVSAGVYTMPITLPSSGSGQGVISVAQNVVSPRNSAATATFTYIGSIGVDISLSAAGVQNEGAISARFDFDYDVPNFSSDLVLVSAGATKGNATVIDDQNRCWVVPVAVPQSGEGEIEVSLPEDAIGFPQVRVAARVQYAPSIPLVITLPSVIMPAIINNDYTLEIDITGNNINSVNVEGLLRPFYHEWVPNNGNAQGKLYIKGRPESFYSELAFKVTANDDNNIPVTANGELNVISNPPIINAPSDAIDLFEGVLNSVLIPVSNNPTDGTVEGTWMGLDHEVLSTGIRIFGDIPSSGLGVNEGVFRLTAMNTGGDAIPKTVRWVISEASPVWDNTLGGFLGSGQNTIVIERGIHYSLNLNSYLTGASPIEVLNTFLGFPNGLNIESNIISGTPTLEGNFRNRAFAATNPIGQVAFTLNYRVLPTNSIPIPSYTGPTSISDINVMSATPSQNTISLSQWFNTNHYSIRGKFAADYELLGIDDNEALYDKKFRHITSDQADNNSIYFDKNLRTLEFRDGIDAHIGTYTVRVKHSNYRGESMTPEFTLNIV